MRRKVVSVLVLLALTLATGSVITRAEPNAPPTPPVPLPDSLSSPSFGYVVSYNNDNPYNPAAPAPGDDLNYMPDGQAQFMLDALNNGNASSAGNPNGYHTGYDNLGFLNPQFGDPVRSVFTFNCMGCDSGNAPADRVNMPAPSYIQSAESCIRLVLGHELFHHTQYAYITFNKWSTWGTMPVEGTARFMQDKIYSDLDANAGCITYRGEVNGFLGTPNQDIWNSSYASALFWNYLSEQLGTQAGEPVLGSDFVTTFWEQAQLLNASPDVAQALRQAISSYSNARSLERLFQDFTIANYTKNMTLTGLPNAARYRYRDEADGSSGNYNAVPTTAATVGVAGSSSVVRWGARYLQANVASCPSPGVVGFQSSGDLTGYTLVGIQGTNTVERMFSTSTTDFARAFIQRTGSPYTTLTAVLTGQANAASVNYLFDCGQARLQIREPQIPAPIAFVGDRAAPEAFLIKVRVVGPASLGEPSVEGLVNSDFQVFVGTEAAANAAPILSGAYVQGDYWLVAQAPEKAPATPDTYNLLVKLGDMSSDTKEGAVVYQVKNVDQVLVIDKSGSMLGPAASPKIVAAKNAASLFVDSARSSDQTSVVSFSGNGTEPNIDAQMLFQLALANAANRTAAKNQINAIAAGGTTSIGDGLEMGRGELLSARGRPVPPTERWIVLLSDGMENEAAFYSTVRAALLAGGVKVNAIALGPLSDQVLMQAIASETGGLYYYVDDPSVGSRPALAAPASVTALPMGLQLADAYATSAEKIQNHERLWEATAGLGSGGSVVLPISVDEGGINDALFTVAFGDGSVKVALFRPDGTQVQDGVGGAQILEGTQHTTLRVGDLTSGVWNLHLDAASGSPTYHAMLSGINKQGARLRLYFGAYSGPQAGEPGMNQFLVGQPMPVFASLTDKKGPIPGARVMAGIQHPDGSSIDLPLFDDGYHNDGEANDGIYGGMYTRTTIGSQSGQTDEVYSKRGSYKTVLHAAGKDNLGQNFDRITRGSFNVVETREQTAGGDTDKDGMPDIYELAHACLKFDLIDIDQDPDSDELPTGDEYELGTDPCNPDTDGGGESDYSEFKRGANPFDPADDALPRPVDPSVISKRADHMDPQPDLRPNANLIRYPANPAYDKIRLLRSTNPDGPFVEVATFGAAANGGLYHDEGLVNNTTYYYRLQGVDLNDARSAPSHVFSGTPRADPFSPVGSVVIADGAAYVHSSLVKLTLRVDPFLAPSADLAPSANQPDADPEASQMLISNDPAFTGAIWQTYTPTRTWTLSPANGYATVFVRYRDAAGNESETYHDDIKVRSFGFLGSIRLRILLHRWHIFAIPNQPTRPTAGEAGTLVRVLGNSELPPFYTDSEGQVILTNLPPGTYDLLIERPGFQPLILHDVVVDSGQTLDLGDVTVAQTAQFLPVMQK